MTIQVQSLAEWVAAGVKGRLSVLIPAHDEEGHIAGTVREIAAALTAAEIDHEILVVADNCSDRTEPILEELSAEIPSLRWIRNPPPNGFGFAVRRGLAAFEGEAVAIVMADGSDRPEDLVAFYREFEKGFDCVFGTRFSRGGKVFDYPLPKLILNRLGNLFIRFLFAVPVNDMTNAFKLYRREVVAGVQPLLARHFNLTVELPLKAVVRGYSYTVVPNTWQNRAEGVSKFRIREMGSRYLFIIFYCWIEKLLSRGDYRQGSQLAEEQLQVWHR